MTNPYNPSFGVVPNQMISRISETEQVYSSFTSDYPSTNIYMIAGIRGSGKTVFLSELSDFFAFMKDWIVIKLNANDNLINTLAKRLRDQQKSNTIRRKSKIEVSVTKFPVYK